MANSRNFTTQGLALYDRAKNAFSNLNQNLQQPNPYGGIGGAEGLTRVGLEMLSKAPLGLSAALGAAGQAKSGIEDYNRTLQQAEKDRLLRLQLANMDNMARENVAMINNSGDDGSLDPTTLIQNSQYLNSKREEYQNMTVEEKQSPKGQLLKQEIDDIVGIGGAGKYNPVLAYEKSRGQTAGKQGREFDEPLTVGQVSTDEKFGTFYVNYIGEKGRGAKNIGNFEKLEDAQEIMEYAAKNGVKISGIPQGIIANRPSLAAYFNEQGVMAQERVAAVVQQSLKEILGGQFTEKEGEALILRGYNPNLSAEENLERLLDLKAQVQQIIESEQDTVSYYENNNASLAGYKRKRYTVDDFSRDLIKDYKLDIIDMSDQEIQEAYVAANDGSLWEKTLEEEVLRRNDKRRP